MICLGMDIVRSEQRWVKSGHEGTWFYARNIYCRVRLGLDIGTLSMGLGWDGRLGGDDLIWTGEFYWGVN